MKKLLILLVAILSGVSAYTQSVGIGTTTPTHYFHILPPVGAGDPVRIEGLQAFNSETDVLVVDPTSGVIRTLPFLQLLDMDTIYFNDTSYTLLTDSLLGDTIFLDSLMNLINTDDQNIDSVTIKNGTLTVYIENGNWASVNLVNTIDSLIFNQSDSLYTFVSDSSLKDSIWIKQLDSLLGIYGDTIFFNDTSFTLYRDSLLGDSIFIDSLISLLRDSINTDDQNIDSAVLGPGNILTIYIEDGSPATVNLNSLVKNPNDLDTVIGNEYNTSFSFSGTTLTLVDGGGTRTVNLSSLNNPGTDDQNIDSVILTGNILEVFIENGTSATVDLSSLNNTGTDDQNIDSMRLNGTILTTYIENGLSSNIDLQPIIDSALANVPSGSDDQNIDSVTLNGNILEVYIENGTSSSVDLSSLNNTGTDDQNIDSVVLTGNILEVFIENGTSATVDLSSLNNTGTDDQQVDNFSLSGTTLTLEMENDGQPAHTVNLASLQDGTGTDDQNIDSVTLVGTNLTVYIENGSSATVDVSSLSGTGTDDQNIDSIRLNGTILTTYIESGLSANIDLQPIIDSAIANSTGTDDQQVDNFSLSGTTLTLEMENDGQPAHTVNLASLQDGTGTDDQNIDSVTLVGTNLTVYIENGSSATVDVSSLSGTGTDDQNIDSIRLNGTILTTYIESGLSANIDLQPIIDSAIANSYGGDNDWDVNGNGTGLEGNPGTNTASGTNSIAAGDGNIASGGYSVSFGLNDTATGIYSTISGGEDNNSTATHSTVGGGRNNTVNGVGGVISGGRNNAITGIFANTIGGGDNNTISGSSTSVIAGGSGNNTSQYASVISGGINNSITGQHGVITGGPSHTISGNYSTVSGGSGNQVNGDYGHVSGRSNVSNDYGEWVGGLHATIGSGNTTSFISTDRLFVVGNGTSTAARSNALTLYKDGSLEINEAYTLPNTDGTANQVLRTDGSGNVSWGTVAAGGDSDWDINGNGTGLEGNPGVNTASGSYSISAGTNNIASGFSSVTFGNLNTASGNNAIVSGGERNLSSGSSTVVGGGYQDTAIGGYSAVTGGRYNKTTGSYSGVYGGYDNTASGNYSFIGAGNTNVASGISSTASGNGNTASGSYSVTFGSGHNASGGYSGALSGLNHTITAGNSLIAGGDDNDVLNSYSAVLGGQYNNVTTNAPYSSISGGQNNTANGSFSRVAGGRENTAASYGEWVGGLYSTTYVPSSTSTWAGTDRLFVVGNGTSTAARSNALTLYKDGSLEINEAYTLPNADGAASQVLQTDGSGNVSWATVAAGGDSDWDINANTTGLEGNPGSNVASGAYAVAAGQSATASGANSTAFGRTVVASATEATVSGGRANNATGIRSTVGGGQSNDANGASATVGGGYVNKAVANVTTIAGGEWNVANGTLSTISGGNYDTTNGNYSIIAGGTLNRTEGLLSTVSGGTRNVAQSYGEWVGGLFSTPYSASSTNSWVGTDRLFVVGNGANAASPSNGLVLYKDGSLEINEAYTLPNADGAAGQVLQTDGSGNVTWAAAGGSGNNIYNTDGTLTANRTLDGTNTRSLTFNDLNGFTVNSSDNITLQTDNAAREISLVGADGITILAGFPATPRVGGLTVDIKDDTIRLGDYPNTRDDAETPVNFLSTSANGNIISLPVDSMIRVVNSASTLKQSFTFTFDIVDCTTPIPSISGFPPGKSEDFFTVPPSMNGWVIESYFTSACTGTGTATGITTQIQIDRPTPLSTINLCASTLTDAEVPWEGCGGWTLNTGDMLRAIYMNNFGGGTPGTMQGLQLTVTITEP